MHLIRSKMLIRSKLLDVHIIYQIREGVQIISILVLMRISVENSCQQFTTVNRDHRRFFAPKSRNILSSIRINI